MSYDLYFWPFGAAVNPRQLADRLADESADGLGPDDRVLAFRAELLHRWPDLADMIAPWHDDLGWRQPWGQTGLADRFVGVTLPYGWEDIDTLPVLAGTFGLDTYDPQSDQLVSPGPRPLDAARRDGATHVEGWVAEDHVVRLLRQVSAHIGYPYDDLDEAALTGAFDDTNDETVDRWFEYPLAGTAALVVRLARSADRALVRVNVDGSMDLVLAARIEQLLDLP
ncbi:hypothetical protein ACWER9_12790 [Micromonospora sp. NPDC003944]